MRFDEAVQAVITGDAKALRKLLAAEPELIRERSATTRATLLHYIAANGVEDEFQKTPANAVEIARILLEAGAEPDALADMYGGSQTTMSMLVSSCHPAEAGAQAALAGLLLDYGAATEGKGSGRTPLITALAFGYPDTAEALARRGARTDTLPAAAGLGRANVFAELLPSSMAEERHEALALAAQHGHAGIVSVLLDAGEDPDRFNPVGFHSHSTPLHQAAWGNHLEVVRLLRERGARLDIEDLDHHGTPLNWAEYGGRTAVADYLRSAAV